MECNAYTYSDLEQPPCISKILEEIEFGDFSKPLYANSEDSARRELSWHPVNKVLHIWFQGALSPTELSDLDTIVASSIGLRRVNKPTQQITREIFRGAGSQEQISRLLDALDTTGSFLAACDLGNYPVAKLRTQKAVDVGIITEADRDYVCSKIPDSNYEPVP